MACTTHAQCNQGTCFNNACLCYPEFVEYQDVPCVYHQLSSVVATCLSIFFGPTGADWFYLSCGQASYIAGGLVKACVGPLLGALLGHTFNERLAIALCWWVLTWLFDVVRLMARVFPDGNSVALF